MRRLYILLAAALLASTLVGMVASGASAQNANKKYAAIVTNEKTAWTAYFYGSSKSQAINRAMDNCLRNSGFSDDKYCEGVGWVKDGWISYWTDNNKPNFAWGFGWSGNFDKADASGEYYCEQQTHLQCHRTGSLQTSRWPGKTTGGSF
jgi:hypothetical protein